MVIQTPRFGGEGKYIDVDGLRTHYFDVGEGPVVVALHGGEFGASALLGWEYNLDVLAQGFRVIAPDWLGYGESAKVHDFENFYALMMRHMRRFLEQIGVRRAAFVGNSMGAAFLLRDAASFEPTLPIDAIVGISGGGRVEESQRHALTDFGGTRESMVRLLEALFHQRSWSTDEDYINRRLDSSLVPGAWECAAAARFRSPVRAPSNVPDVEYSSIRVPTLLIAGEQDVLKPTGWADELQRQIPESHLLLVPRAGHCPQIEEPDAVHEAMVPFLRAQG